MEFIKLYRIHFFFFFLVITIYIQTNRKKKNQKTKLLQETKCETKYHPIGISGK